MISSEEIVAITQNVMGTMFELCPMNDEAHPDLESGDAFTGCVQISGQWQGAVLIQGTPDLAKTIAGHFFEMDPSQVTEADIRDAIAEFTNMIGGNIKGQVQLPHTFPFHLSQPAATLTSTWLAPQLSAKL